MSYLDIFIRPGFWVKTKDRVKGALDLRKYVRSLLEAMNVPSYDSCCPLNTAGQPVRVNSSTGDVEYFDGTNWVAADSAPTNNAVFTGSFRTGGTPQTLTGAGAVNLTTFTTLLVTTGANALTLAAGAEGQHKFIKMKTDGGDGTLTVTNLQGGTTLTFNDAGDFVYLFYTDSKWNILTNSGATLA